MQAELDKLYSQRACIDNAIQQLEIEEQAVRKLYREAYKDEVDSRRKAVAEQKVLFGNIAPHAQWKAFKRHLDRITRHRDYRWDAANRRNYVLLINLAKFTSEMLGICNTQTWNQRNSNPHLP